jgi:hypothetical protein
VIAVNDLTRRIDGEASIRVAVVSDSQVGSNIDNGFLQQREIG